MEGILNILKPPGMTSSNVVTDVRRLFGMKRVGHTGTLDPGAAGVLPVCLNRATKLFDYLADKKKEYIAEIAFGYSTDTDDSYGAIINNNPRRVDKEELLEILPQFKGKITQVSPLFSALKTNGTAHYKMARQGKEVERRKREIEVYGIELLDKTGENTFLIKVNCSKGTYIRALARDMGERLNTYAHLSFLLRTETGIFNIEESITIKELEQLKNEHRLIEAVMPVEKALLHLPGICLKDSNKVKQLINGCIIQSESHIDDEAYCRVYGDSFLGLGELSKGKLKLKIHFTETD